MRAKAIHTILSMNQMYVKTSKKQDFDPAEQMSISYLPYQKGIYNLKELTLDAQRCRTYWDWKKSVLKNGIKNLIYFCLRCIIKCISANY